MNRKQRNAMELEDRKRRNARKMAERVQFGETRLNAPEGIDEYHWSRNITGTPAEQNRQTKASDDCWKRGLKRTRTVGTADGKSQTVKVFSPDGTTRIRKVSEYRKPTQNVAGIKRRKPTQLVTVKQTRVMPIKANDPRFGTIGNID